MDESATSPKVYIVDDDPAARTSLGALVRTRGLLCEEFPSAEAFLRVLDADVAGAVITDQRMEGMSGLDLQQALAERGSLLPVIVVSGHADVPIAVKFMARGAVTLLQKPYDDRDLLEAIDAALQHNAGARQVAERLRTIGARLRSLSREEEQIMALMMEGQVNKVIAQDVGASSRTVDRRRRRVLDKMHVDSVAELVQVVAEHRHAQLRLSPQFFHGGELSRHLVGS